jgi:hypothetical protein
MADEGQRKVAVEKGLTSLRRNRSRCDRRSFVLSLALVLHFVVSAPATHAAPDPDPPPPGLHGTPRPAPPAAPPASPPSPPPAITAVTPVAPSPVAPPPVAPQPVAPPPVAALPEPPPSRAQPEPQPRSERSRLARRPPPMDGAARVRLLVSQAEAASDDKPFLLAALALGVVALGSTTLLLAVIGTRRRVAAFR